jgi:putative hydrolase of the HAD superfamily
MLAVGGFAAHVPHPLVWAIEAADPPVGHPRFRDLPDLAGVPAVADELLR